MSPPLPRLRARTQLTLWYLLLLVGTLIGLGAVGYWLTGQELYANADDVLRSKAGAVETETDNEDGPLVFDKADFPPNEVAVLAGLDLARIWDDHRRSIYVFDGLGGVPATPAETIDNGLVGHDGFLTARGPDGSSVRSYFKPLYNGTKIIGVLQVGRSQADIEYLLSRLRLAGVGGVLAAVLLGWGGGYLLARRALAPVDQITRAAKRIGAQHLAERLPAPAADDELGRLALAFNDMIDRLDRAFRRERQFTADASHELRTPVAVIRTQSEVALDHPREAGYDQRVLGSIRDESARLGRLLEHLMVLTRADAGQTLDLRPIDLPEVVTETCARMAPQASSRGIRLVVSVEDVNPLVGDATWLTQVLLNLLDNAFRYTAAGGEVVVTLEGAGPGAVLSVADTGEGIAPEHLPHLFERFYRVDQARSSGGAGLGLAISRWVVQAHHGEIEVESTPGQGTRVTARLPWAPGGAQDRRARVAVLQETSRG